MKRSTGIILSALWAAFALRVWSLSTQSIWWDEAFTWQTASHGLVNFWQMLLTGDRNPPLYFVSVAMWGGLAGWSEFSLRFVSVAWSMVGLAFLFNLAKRLYNTSAGLWAVALAAIAPALVLYAQEARMYAAFFALTAATLYYGWRLLDSDFGHQSPDVRLPPSAFSLQKSASGFLFCEAGLLLTHYFAIPLVVTLNLFALGVLIRRRARFAIYAKWISGQMLAALPIAVWTLIVLTTPSSLVKAQETPPGMVAYVDQTVKLWLSGARDVQGEWLALPWLVVLTLLVTLIGAWLVSKRSTRWLIAFAALSLVTAYGMTLLLTSFHPRYVLPYSVPMFAMLGAALSNLSAPGLAGEKRSTGKRRLVGATAASLILVALVAGEQAASAPTSAKDDARGMAVYLKQNASAGDVILLEANDYTLNYYDHGPARTAMITATTETGALQQLRAAVGSARRVWLSHWLVSTQDSRGYWPFLLEFSGSLKDQTSFHGYELAEYEMRSSLREPELKPASTGGMVTQHTDLNGQVVDGALALALTWQTPVKLFDPARVSVRLIDARGNVLNARDAALLDARGRTTDRWDALDPATNYYVLPIPPGTPPGTYTITAQLYNARDVLSDELVSTIDLPRRLDTSDPYRTLAGYHWDVPSNTQIAPGLALEAYAVSPQRPWQPMPLDVTVRWRKTGDVSDWAPRLRLVQASRVWSETGSSLLGRDYPARLWASGETVIDRLKIDYPPVRGPLELQIGQGDQWITLTTLQLDESQLMFDLPQLQHTQAAQFGDFARLLGYDLKSDSLSATRPLDLRLYWQATNTEPITTPHTVFTQILAPDGHLVAQHDAPPNLPPAQWVPGQVVTDDHSIKVVDPAYRGPAALIVGWYNSATIERVPVRGGGDFVILTVPVRVEEK